MNSDRFIHAILGACLGILIVRWFGIFGLIALGIIAWYANTPRRT